MQGPEPGLLRNELNRAYENKPNLIVRGALSREIQANGAEIVRKAVESEQAEALAGKGAAANSDESGPSALKSFRT